jgi:hypothetical protein
MLYINNININTDSGTNGKMLNYLLPIGFMPLLYGI